jgi:hypothetical protein
VPTAFSPTQHRPVALSTPDAEASVTTYSGTLAMPTANTGRATASTTATARRPRPVRTPAAATPAAPAATASTPEPSSTHAGVASCGFHGTVVPAAPHRTWTTAYTAPHTAAARGAHNGQRRTHDPHPGPGPEAGVEAGTGDAGAAGAGEPPARKGEFGTVIRASLPPRWGPRHPTRGSTRIRRKDGWAHRTTTPGGAKEAGARPRAPAPVPARGVGWPDRDAFATAAWPGAAGASGMIGRVVGVRGWPDSPGGGHLPDEAAKSRVDGCLNCCAVLLVAGTVGLVLLVVVAAHTIRFTF